MRIQGDTDRKRVPEQVVRGFKVGRSPIRSLPLLLVASVCYLSLNPLCAQPTSTWAYKVGGTTADAARSIAVDGSGNVFITGYFTGTNRDFDPGPGVANLSAGFTGTSDVFLAKYTAAGSYLWAFKIGVANDDKGYAVAVDQSSGDVCVMGTFRGTVDFDPGPGVASLVTSTTTDRVFVAKYSSAGAYIWAFLLGPMSSGGGEGNGHSH